MIPNADEDEDTTRDIQTIFSDIVKVSFNQVNGNGDDVQRGKRPAAEVHKGRWCLVCK